MKEDMVKEVGSPEESSRDVLTEVLRTGAQRLLAQMIEMEVKGWIDAHAALVDAQGHRCVVRNGRLPSRTILTGVGRVEVSQPRVRDRRPAGEAEKFSSKILPPYLRKTKSIEELIPWLYLRGISTGDFQQALQALLGPNAAGLSAATITRLKEVWKGEYEQWSKRSLEGKQYVYVWADGVHFNVRLWWMRRAIAVWSATAACQPGPS